MGPSAEEFARWRDDRVTQWVFKALNLCAEENKEAWLQESWVGGVADQAKLIELKTRSDAYRAIIEAPYEAHCETNGDDPSYDQG